MFKKVICQLSDNSITQVTRHLKYNVEFDGNRILILTGQLSSGDTIGCRLRRIHIRLIAYYVVEFSKNGRPIMSKVVLDKCSSQHEKTKGLKIYPIISFNSPGLILVTDLGGSEYFSGNGNFLIICIL